MASRRTPAQRETSARPAPSRGAGGVTPPADVPAGPSRLRSPAGSIVLPHSDELAGHLEARGYRRV